MQKINHSESPQFEFHVTVSWLIFVVLPLCYQMKTDVKVWVPQSFYLTIDKQASTPSKRQLFCEDPEERYIERSNLLVSLQFLQSLQTQRIYTFQEEREKWAVDSSRWLCPGASFFDCFGPDWELSMQSGWWFSTEEWEWGGLPLATSLPGKFWEHPASQSVCTELSLILHSSNMSHNTFKKTTLFSHYKLSF